VSVDTRPASILLIGYGNPGRHDDGLGPALAKRLEQAALAGVDIDIDYQLNIEHAYDLAAYDVVVFADAARSDGAGEQPQSPFYFHPLDPGNPISFSTHSVSPQAVMRLACDLFQAKTQAYVLGITGYEFEEIGEGLTQKAAHNLDQAEAFITDRLVNATHRNNKVGSI